jgi:hypothetical protein
LACRCGGSSRRVRPIPRRDAFLTDPDNDDDVAVVSFDRCLAIKHGSPKDEVLEGHPLYAHGLTFYAAHEVENSPWLADLLDVNRVHRRFDPRNWDDLRHFVFTFKDSTVEVIARGYVVEKASDGLSGAAARMAARGS